MPYRRLTADMGRRTVKKTMVAVIVAGVTLLGFPGTASAQTTGRQTFILSQVGDQPEATVYAAGPIRGVGRDIVVNEEFDDEAGTFVSEDVLRFRDGDVFVTFTGQAMFDFDPVRCIGKFSGTATYEITGGTRRYAGASGSGSGTFRGVFVAGRNPDGTCSEDEDDESVSVFFANLRGTTTLGGAQRAA